MYNNDDDKEKLNLQNCLLFMFIIYYVQIIILKLFVSGNRIFDVGKIARIKNKIQ